MQRQDQTALTNNEAADRGGTPVPPGRGLLTGPPLTATLRGLEAEYVVVLNLQQ